MNKERQGSEFKLSSESRSDVRSDCVLMFITPLLICSHTALTQTPQPPQCVLLTADQQLQGTPTHTTAGCCGHSRAGGRGDLVCVKTPHNPQPTTTLPAHSPHLWQCSLQPTPAPQPQPQLQHRALDSVLESLLPLNPLLAVLFTCSPLMRLVQKVSSSLLSGSACTQCFGGCR